MSEFLTRNEHKEFADHMKSEHENIERRLGALEKLFNKMNSIVVSVEKLALSVENMQKEQINQGKRLEEIEEIPAQNWNTVKSAIITGVISVAIGILVGALGF